MCRTHFLSVSSQIETDQKYERHVVVDLSGRIHLLLLFVRSPCLILLGEVHNAGHVAFLVCVRRSNGNCSGWLCRVLGIVCTR